MLNVIPVINCLDELCVKERVQRIEQCFGKQSWVHLDVADGCFTFHKTWNDPSAWSRIGGGLSLEVHLMVEHPHGSVLSWTWAGAKRIIVHLETLHKMTAKAMAEMAKVRNTDVMLAINPETPVERLQSYFKLFSQFQILAVNPGLAGQAFLPTVLGKIKFLRRQFPGATIEVDGGINLETAKLVRAAGADTVVSATYIFGNSNPKRAYEALQNV